MCQLKWGGCMYFTVIHTLLNMWCYWRGAVISPAGNSKRKLHKNKTSKAWENFKCDRYWSILLRDKPLTFKLKTVNFQSDLINLRMHIHLKKTQKNNANFSWIWPIKNNITFVFITLCCHICTVVEETNVLNRPLSHIYGGLIPLLVIAFICLQFYHYWRWLAVPPDAFWRALCELEMCAPGVMEAPLGTT